MSTKPDDIFQFKSTNPQDTWLLVIREESICDWNKKMEILLVNIYGSLGIETALIAINVKFVENTQIRHLVTFLPGIDSSVEQRCEMVIW